MTPPDAVQMIIFLRNLVIISKSESPMATFVRFGATGTALANLEFPSARTIRPNQEKLRAVLIIGLQRVKKISHMLRIRGGGGEKSRRYPVDSLFSSGWGKTERVCLPVRFSTFFCLSLRERDSC